MSGTLNANYVQADVGTNLNLNSGGAVGSVIVANNGSITSTTNGGLLAVGNTLNYTDTGIIASFAGNTASYGYVVVQNQSPANTAYSSYAVYNNTGNYMEIGVNSSNYSYSAAGYANNNLQLANAGFIYAANDMVVGTWGANSIHFVTNGSTSTTDAMNISSTGVTTFANPISAPNTFGFKNRIINGAMTIDQRNSGASTTPGSGSVYVVDRWKSVTNVGSKYTCQQTPSTTETGYATRIAAGFQNYLAVTSNSAYSVGSFDYFNIAQPIEGFNVADLMWGTSSAKTITISFWVYSSLTGTFSASLFNSAANRCYLFTYSIASANTWQQVSVTVPGDTSGTWVNNNGIGLDLDFCLAGGSSVLGSAGSWGGTLYRGATGQTSLVGTNGATFYITGVQLEVGTQATSFDYRPYGTELALCQRYLPAFASAGATQSQISMGQCLTSTTAACVVPFPVSVRTPPTGISASGTFNMTQSNGTSTSASLAFSQSSTLCCQIIVTGSGLSAGNATILAASPGGNGLLLFTGCEL